MAEVQLSWALCFRVSPKAAFKVLLGLQSSQGLSRGGSTPRVIYVLGGQTHFLLAVGERPLLVACHL